MKLMRSGLIITLSLLAGVLVNGCKNDLKLNAPYKEVPSIYAVLNPSEPMQMIRINKVFLGEGNANQMAKVSDSVNYQHNDLTVTLDRYVNGVQVDACPTCTDQASIGNKRTITFTDSLIQTQEGAFSTMQRVYITHADLHQDKPILQAVSCGINSVVINTNTNWKVYGDYVLTVKNNKTGNVFTARASAIDSVSGYTPLQPFTCPYYPYAANTDPKLYVDYSDQNTAFTVNYVAQPTTGSVYQLILRLHFYDYDFSTGPRDNYVDYVLARQNRKDAQLKFGLPFLTASFKGVDLFSAAGIALSKAGLNMGINRQMYKIEYIIYSSTDDYYDFLQFNAPSLSLTQNKPLYSNFDNSAALGIFTFRARCTVAKSIATTFVSEFSRNNYTCNYRFLDANNTLLGCQP